ncbi:MAG: hypothetical protein IPJ54_18395 [Saprospiraceae bacterium]|nr:hypothetical protein [Saprospiraceae bacterium]
MKLLQIPTATLEERIKKNWNPTRPWRKETTITNDVLTWIVTTTTTTTATKTRNGRYG